MPLADADIERIATEILRRGPRGEVAPIFSGVETALRQNAAKFMENRPPLVMADFWVFAA
jgi:hypothetical protein